MNFVDKYNLLSNCRFGFRNYHLTKDDVDDVTKQFIKKFSGIIWIDLKKDFDTIDHSIVLAKLNI